MTAANHSPARPPQWLDDLVVGQAIDPMSLPLTLQRMVMEAGVNRDFTPLHHDHEDTLQTGARAVYTNTIFIQAFLEAMLRTWMGDHGRLEELAIKMVSFNFVDTLATAGGTVRGVDHAPGADSGSVALDVWMRSDDVLTVTGTASVSLPVAPQLPVNGDATMVGAGEAAS